ncbi:unannotated protein [freshwater metagenome]|uniref:Unannotated protein n=1 Tax=freshwater metagenome TaxID=449393 RepID=A0A6J7SK55_9ZZZZ|nr:hypothetical protein [Actinomycetota bacterium]
MTDRASRTRAIPLVSVGAVIAAMVLVLGSLVFAPVASAQTCVGSVSTTVAAASLPGGSWAVEGGCLTSDSFFEYSNTEGRAQVALSSVTYADGHAGRVAVGMLVMTGGAALSIVGVEDAATGLVKWSAVLGTAVQVGDQTTVSGEGIMVFPVESVQVSASITGTGTNIATIPESTVPESTVPAASAPDPTVPVLPAPVLPAPEPTAPDLTAPEPTVPEPTTSLAPVGDGNRS